MPSSSLVEVEGGVEVEVDVGVEVEVGGEVWVGVEVFDLQMKSYHPFRVKSYFSGRVGGWLEIWGLKLISTQVEVEV